LAVEESGDLAVDTSKHHAGNQPGRPQRCHLVRVRVSLLYAVRTTTGWHLDDLALELPLAVQWDGTDLVLREASEEFRWYGPLVLEVSGAVDPTGLARATLSGIDRTAEPFSSPVTFIAVPEAAALRDLVVNALGALSFAVGVGLSSSRLIFHDHLVPETSTDDERLEELGSPHVLPELSVGRDVRTFHLSVVQPELLKQLMMRPGAALFADALNAIAPVARFRELWRILKSAFGLQGRELTQALAGYQPAAEMSFTYAELESLRTIRGRASHAASRAGTSELLTIEREVMQALGRVQSLVERVILTKKTWGARGGAVDELLRLQTYIGQDGHITEPDGRPGGAPN
jgi:hypothetical protein